MDQEAQGRLVREAWIAGVKRYVPGTPKPSYIAPWEAMPDWERQTDADMFTAIKKAVLDEAATPVGA